MEEKIRCLKITIRKRWPDIGSKLQKLGFWKKTFDKTPSRDLLDQTGTEFEFLKLIFPNVNLSFLFQHKLHSSESYYHVGSPKIDKDK
jgi:hypothetical protein